MRYALAILAISLVACGDEPDSVAEIGWQFDYQDYTDDTQPEDLRSCDNAPPSSYAGPAYNAIDTVTVNIEDAAGQVPGVDNRDYDCSQGAGGTRIPIRGIVRQAYTVTLEAKTASGAVLYRFHQADVDFSSKLVETFLLPTRTGELHFTPQYSGQTNPYECPAGVAKIRYTLYRKEGGTAETTPTLTGIMSPACEDDGFGNQQARDLYIREIPVLIESGSRDTYNDYELVTEALDASDTTLYCRRNVNRSVRPGDNSLSQNELLDSGVCP